MLSLRILVTLWLWLEVLMLERFARELSTRLLDTAHWRVALIAEPEAAVSSHCATPADFQGTALTCHRELAWYTSHGRVEVCTEPLPTAWPRRRYELTVACRGKLGSWLVRLPLLTATVFR